MMLAAQPAHEADPLIEGFTVACLGIESRLGLVGYSLDPRAAYARSVRRRKQSRRWSTNKRMASSIAIASFLLACCAASGPELANSAEDIAGV